MTTKQQKTKLNKRNAKSNLNNFDNKPVESTTLISAIEKVKNAIIGLFLFSSKEYYLPKNTDRVLTSKKLAIMKNKKRSIA